MKNRTRRIRRAKWRRTFRRKRRSGGGGPNIDIFFNFGSKPKAVSEGERLLKSIVATQPTVTFQSIQNDKHTLIMWDPDAPEPSYLHWLVTNIPGSDISKGQVAMNYAGPTPPSGTHRYYIGVYRQDTEPLDQLGDLKRSGWNNEEFISKYNLTPIGQTYFTVKA